MKNNLKNTKIKLNKMVPLDKFVEDALYNKKFGYYTNNISFGKKGDFITAPIISNLFSEIVGIWIVSSWEQFGKPKKFNLVELGPGDGSMAEVLISTFKRFPKFYKSIDIFMYEKSDYLKRKQKNKINNKKVKWISNFNKVKDGPIIFYGNEFFDAIPIKQFLRDRNKIKEKYYFINKNGLNETFKNASKKDTDKINSFSALKKLKFIEYPKKGFVELGKMTKKIIKHKGGILLIDYGFIKPLNKNTIKAVMKNKKIDINEIVNNYGDIDITSLVNFNLVHEFFLKEKLKVKNVVSQKFFLERMGIIERSKILGMKMNSKQKNDVNFTLLRLLHKEFMGDLFKVIFAYKNKNENFLGFN